MLDQNFAVPSFLAALLIVGAASTAHAGECDTWLPGPLVSSGPNGTDGVVYAAVSWDPDGAGPQPELLAIGGEITIVEGVAANDVAIRSAANGQWEALGTGVVGNVRALAVFKNELHVAGVFSTVDGVAANNIARWDGTTWHPLGSGVQLNQSGTTGVYALTVFNGQLIAGGQFTSAGGVSAGDIAAWNGSSWTSFQGGTADGFNDWVNCLTVHLGELIVGGQLLFVGGVNAANIARWNGFFWQPLGTGMNSWVSGLASLNGELIAGGNFTGAGGVAASRTARWNGSNWSALSDVVFPVSMMGVHNGQVYTATTTGSLGQFYFLNGSNWNNVTSLVTRADCMTTFQGSLVLGGFFNTLGGGVTANNIARRIGTTWHAFGGEDVTIVRSMHAFGPRLLVGGTFNQEASTGEPVRALLAWDGSTISSLGLGAGEIRDLYSRDLADGSGNHELIVCRAAAPYVMRATVNPTAEPFQPTLASMGPTTGASTLNDAASTIERFNNEYFIGGDFNSTGHPATLGRNYIARWNGASWAAVSGGVDANVHALKTYNGALYVGGAFASAQDGGVQTIRMARWNGSAWSAVNNTVFNGLGVHALEVYNGRLIVGGQFPGPANSPNIAAFDGSTVTSIGPFGQGGANGAVYTLKTIGDRLYIGGNFTMIDGVPAQRIAYWDGNAWHAVAGGADSTVFAIDSYNDQIQIGGLFNIVNGATPAPKWAYFEECSLCPADVNGDSVVNITDLLAVISAWGGTGANPADVNGDQIVNVLDLLAVIAAWGACS